LIPFPAAAATTTEVKKPLPIVIVGAGLSGLSLALSLSHRGIPFSIHDSDPSQSFRSQGYSLTMQHSRITAELGLKLDRIHSSRHIVINPKNETVAQWGRALWGAGARSSERAKKGKYNFHLARGALRDALISELVDSQKETINWGSRFTGFKESERCGAVTAEFDGAASVEARLLVGADGVNSIVRQRLYDEKGGEPHPLAPCNVTVSLGIFTPPSKGDPVNSNELTDMLDGETVVQVADGAQARIYFQPYDERKYMWQFSYRDSPWIGKQEPLEIMKNVVARCGDWCDGNVRSLLDATPLDKVTSYSIVDRSLPDDFRDGHEMVTLLGDAAHPMTPFKGWGGNAALRDGLSLSRRIHNAGGKIGEGLLRGFEADMLERVRRKVESSREAIDKLHGEKVLTKSNVTRGSL
jgi:2-polyprenyl-6-methoxyphenol hydroxylase-like FAD-dependent oxidoreductase